jgi:hypothetical protein
MDLQRFLGGLHYLDITVLAEDFYCNSVRLSTNDKVGCSISHSQVVNANFTQGRRQRRIVEIYLPALGSHRQAKRRT